MSSVSAYLSAFSLKNLYNGTANTDQHKNYSKQPKRAREIKHLWQKIKQLYIYICDLAIVVVAARFLTHSFSTFSFQLLWIFIKFWPASNWRD